MWLQALDGAHGFAHTDREEGYAAAMRALKQVLYCTWYSLFVFSSCSICRCSSDSIALVCAVSTAVLGFAARWHRTPSCAARAVLCRCTTS